MEKYNKKIDFLKNMIDILLATYNGDKYLDTQIASIVNQSYKDWVLYIHDDGSSDNTVKLIQKWCNLDKRIIFVEDGIEFHNCGDNFMHLLKQSTSEYVCFSDQDDYWFDYKLEKMIKVFPKTTSPHLLCTNCYLWDSSNIGKPSLYCPISLREILFRNGGLQGCAMMFNQSLKSIVVDNLANNNVFMHDYIVTLAALSLGSVSYLKEPLFLYRNHATTVTDHPPKNIKDKISLLIKHKKLPIITDKAFKDFTLFRNCFGRILDSEHITMVDNFLSICKKNLLGRFFALLFSNYTLDGSHLKLIIKVIMRPFFSYCSIYNQ